ncbi:NAD(P)H-dependent oxidoreductase subunit E [Clostridium sp.]|jgi:NADH-quinone oxidoreductase subunit E|uniref:NAD(P)H-dependent oxidoreductase subunit E n=1 Tax=Clostridium sp. TaxID=1506 RepID=UPI002FDD7407
MITALQQNSKNSLSLQEVIEKYPKKQRFILPIIHDIQRQYKYIPRQSLESLSEYRL